MKKTYVKPEIELESFTLSTNIASGCVTITTQAEIDAEEKEVKLWNPNAFADDCAEQIICYHVPNGNLVFTS